MLAHVCIRHILFSKGIFCLSQWKLLSFLHK
jgi:hypothetical protein